MILLKPLAPLTPKSFAVFFDLKLSKFYTKASELFHSQELNIEMIISSRQHLVVLLNSSHLLGS